MERIIWPLEKIKGASIVATGLTIDRENSKFVNFPVNKVTQIKTIIGKSLKENIPILNSFLSSACAGFDLLLIEYFLEYNKTHKNNIHGYIFLPYDEESFIKDIVYYSPLKEEWLKIFKEAKSDSNMKVIKPIFSHSKNEVTKNYLLKNNANKNDPYNLRDHFTTMGIEMVKKVNKEKSYLYALLSKSNLNITSRNIIDYANMSNVKTIISKI